MTKKNSRTLAFLGIWLGILLVGGLSGSETAAQGRSSGDDALRVGVSPVFPPMVFKQKKELVGVEIDLARAFGESLGRQVVFVELPWEDQIETLNAGGIDIIMSSMSITMARRYAVDFSRPYLTIGQMALVRSEDEHKYLLGFPFQLPGVAGTLTATTGEFLVQREFPKAKRKSFKTETEAVQALKKKKIELFFSDSTLIYYLAATHATDGLVAVPVTLIEEQLGWGVRKGNETLLNAANTFLQKASGDGTMNRIFHRWMAVPQ